MKLQLVEGQFTVEFEGDSQKDLFGQIASFQEVFGNKACGKCGSTNLRFVVRTVDENDYYELRCLDCGAKLAFGVNKKGGGLFPKRTEKVMKDGKEETVYLPNGGWLKYNPKTGKNE